MFKSRLAVRVGFGDCDPAKLVYYPRYFEWFDRATWHLFESVGLPWPVLWNEYRIVGLPLVDARAEFRRPVRWGDELVIESGVRRWGRKSFDVGHVVRRGDDVCAEGTETHVWGVRAPDDPERIVGAPIPGDVIERLAGATEG